MKLELLKGFSFGITSAIITTLGIIVGLNATTHSKIVIIGGIISIAIADAFSDAIGLHIAEESQIKKTKKEIWLPSITAFITKFVFALIFIFPIIIFQNSTAIIISLIWGLTLLAIFSYYLAIKQKIQPWKVIVEHLLIAIIVIFITHQVGQWIANSFI